MKTIGIFGAAFDPLHCGHLAISRLALASGLVDEVLLMPSPARWDKQPVASDAERFSWAQMAASYERAHGPFNVTASDFELRLGTFRGTYRLLSELKQQTPQHTYKLLLGQDSLQSLPHWRDASTQTLNGLQLLKEFGLVVVPRGNKVTEVALPDWALTDNHHIEILPPFAAYEKILADLGSAEALAKLASSEIKRQLASGTAPSGYSLPEIENRIQSLGLYLLR